MHLSAKVKCGKEYRVNDFQILEKGSKIFSENLNINYNEINS